MSAACPPLLALAEGRRPRARRAPLEGRHDRLRQLLDEPAARPADLADLALVKAEGNA